MVKIRTNEQFKDDCENKFIEALNKIAEKCLGNERAEKAIELYKKSCEQKFKKDKSC